MTTSTDLHPARPPDHPQPDGMTLRLAQLRRRLGSPVTPCSAPAVTLLAVSKYADVAAMRAARDAGQVDFGESRAQDLKVKVEEVPGARWHFVGRLQRNKVADVVGRVTLIHSVDGAELAERIAAQATVAATVQRVLVQVNVGGDPAKAGCSPDAAERLVARIRDLPGIACVGLMTVPPQGVDPQPVFAELRMLRDALHARYPEVQELSMGMSDDLEAAVAEGATIVRVGRALFGEAGSPRRAGNDAGTTDQESR